MQNYDIILLLVYVVCMTKYSVPASCQGMLISTASKLV